MINFIQHTIHKKKQTVLNRRLNIRPLCFCKWDMGVQIIHNKSTSWGDIDDEKTSICITLSKISKRIEKKNPREGCVGDETVLFVRALGVLIICNCTHPAMVEIELQILSC